MLTLTGAVAATVLILLTLCYTRYISSSVHGKSIDNIGEVPKIPYWIPWLGHCLSLMRDPERFIRQVR